MKHATTIAYRAERRNLLKEKGHFVVLRTSAHLRLIRPTGRL